jgi:hypothetical protein
MTTTIESVTESYNLAEGKMKICPNNKGKWITSPTLTYGDYDFSSDVPRANVNYILEKYASNRYHLVSGGWSYTQLYLKRTTINADFLFNLEEYHVICDTYYYNWQDIHSTQYYFESIVSYYPVIHQALQRLHEDTNWTVSENILQALHYFSELWCGGETYYWSGSSYYFTLESNIYATPENIDEVVLYFIDNPPYSKNDLQLITLTNCICSPVEPGEYTVVVQNYNSIELLCGGMSDYKYPFQKVTIEVGDDVATIIREAYSEIVEYNHEFLDYSPI